MAQTSFETASKNYNGYYIPFQASFLSFKVNTIKLLNTPCESPHTRVVKMDNIEIYNKGLLDIVTIHK